MDIGSNTKSQLLLMLPPSPQWKTGESGDAKGHHSFRLIMFPLHLFTLNPVSAGQRFQLPKRQNVYAIVHDLVLY